MSQATEPSAEKATTSSSWQSPLEGVRVCLVYEDDLAEYHRILREIGALKESGARVTWLTTLGRGASAPPDVARIAAPLSRTLPASSARFRPIRIVSNVIRNALRPLAATIQPGTASRHRRRTLSDLVAHTDVFWVVNYPSLPSVLKIAQITGIPVVYETVDLVPEYWHIGAIRRSRFRAGERRLIGRVDGFVTACDSYADYYVERYGDRLNSRPVVVDNTPNTIADEIGADGQPRRLLFFGALRFDRPVHEIIDAVSLVRKDVTLTFQGTNLLGDELHEYVHHSGLDDRITLVPACPVEQMVEAASRHDIGVAALRGDDENERRASTSKLFTYMAAGLAILGSDLPGIARVVNEHRNGLLVQGMEPQAWANAIDKIASLSESALNEMKQRSLNAAHQYSWERQKPLFIAEFVRALGHEPATEA